MKVLGVMLAGLAVGGLVTACASGRSWRVDEVQREGERCEELEVEPEVDGSVLVEGVSFRVPEGFRPLSCQDRAPWLVIGYRAEHEEETHTLVLQAGLQQLDPVRASQITAANRLATLEAFAAGCIEADRNWERCGELEAVSSDLSIAGLDCVGWDEALLDIGVPDAPEGEAWPTRSRTLACFDPGAPPSALIMLTWSERRPPDVEGMTESEVAAQSEAFLTSIEFESD